MHPTHPLLADSLGPLDTANALGDCLPVDPADRVDLPQPTVGIEEATDQQVRRAIRAVEQ